MTVVAMKSWFHDPVGNGGDKAGRDNGFSGVVLDSDDRGFGIKRAVGIPQAQNVGELQRRGAGKENFAGGAELDDRTLLHPLIARLTVMTIAARELNGNANGCGLGKKTGQFANRAGLRRPRLSCGRQLKMRLGSPSSRLGRALGSQNTRLRQKEMHDRDHSAERKD
jgi:hypothetical protein